MREETWKSINEVEWDKLESFWGGLIHKIPIPLVFQNMTSPNEEIRKHAQGYFYDIFSHQHTLTEALYYAIPFLVELVEDEDLEIKHEMINLLAHYGGLTKILSSRLDIYKKIHDQMSSYSTQFLDWLDILPGELRTQIFALLGTLTSNTTTVFPRLMHEWHESSLYIEQVEIITSLGVLAVEASLTEDQQQQFEDLAMAVVSNEDYYWLVRYRAVMSLILYFGERTPEMMLDYLPDIITKAIQQDSDIWDQERSSVILSYLGAERQVDWLMKLTAKFQDGYYLRDILRTAFVSKYSSTLRELPLPLNSLQQRIIQFVIDNEKLEAPYFFKDYFLPTSKEGLGSLLKS